MTTKSVRKKSLDCVEMMHTGAALVPIELEGKSLEEEMAYWRKGTEALLKRQAQLRRKRSHIQGKG
jgi:hypothetical protein